MPGRLAMIALVAITSGLLTGCQALGFGDTAYYCPKYDDAVDCRSGSQRALDRVVSSITLGTEPQPDEPVPRQRASRCSKVCTAEVTEVSCTLPALPACDCEATPVASCVVPP